MDKGKQWFNLYISWVLDNISEVHFLVHLWITFIFTTYPLFMEHIYMTHVSLFYGLCKQSPFF